MWNLIRYSLPILGSRVGISWYIWGREGTKRVFDIVM